MAKSGIILRCDGPGFRGAPPGLRSPEPQVPADVIYHAPKGKRLLALLATIFAVMFICKLYPAV